MPIKKQKNQDAQKANFVLMATKNGVIKKTAIAAYESIRRTGIIAIKLASGDVLRWAKLTTGDDLAFLISKKGLSIKFNEKDVRAMARDTMGVRGIKLKTQDELIGMDVIAKKDTNADLLVITEKGIGKKTVISAWPLQLRGGVGVKAANLTEKTGNIVAAQILTKEDEALILTSQRGQVLRTTLRSVPRLTRDTQGVIIMRLSAVDKIAAATVIKKRREEEEEGQEKVEKGQAKTATKSIKKVKLPQTKLQMRKTTKAKVKKITKTKIKKLKPKQKLKQKTKAKKLIKTKVAKKLLKSPRKGKVKN